MLTIIDYKAGNVRSIQNMLKKIGTKSIIPAKITKFKKKGLIYVMPNIRQDIPQFS